MCEECLEIIVSDNIQRRRENLGFKNLLVGKRANYRSVLRGKSIKWKKQLPYKVKCDDRGNSPNYGQRKIDGDDHSAYLMWNGNY